MEKYQGTYEVLSNNDKKSQASMDKANDTEGYVSADIQGHSCLQLPSEIL